VECSNLGGFLRYGVFGDRLDERALRARVIVRELPEGTSMNVMAVRFCCESLFVLMLEKIRSERDAISAVQGDDGLLRLVSGSPQGSYAVVQDGHIRIIKTACLRVTRSALQALTTSVPNQDRRQVRSVPVAEQGGSPVEWDGRPAILDFFSDITAKKRTEEKIRHLATHDPMTDLPSLRLARDRIGQALSMARRKGWFSAVLFVDLAGFKTINDEFGHDAGDALLREIAMRLKRCVRTVDTVARIGGRSSWWCSPNCSPGLTPGWSRTRS
jgi:predicted signal transduction protein with EAL and GGDEF domain